MNTAIRGGSRYTRPELNLGTFYVALTLDVWSRWAKEDYVSLVVHYVDSDWFLQKRIIGFYLLDMAHTDVDISKRIYLFILSYYNLENLVIGETLDRMEREKSKYQTHND